MPPVAATRHHLLHPRPLIGGVTGGSSAFDRSPGRCHSGQRPRQKRAVGTVPSRTVEDQDGMRTGGEGAGERAEQTVPNR